MTPTFESAADLQAHGPAIGTPPPEDNEESWGHECALPYLQGLAGAADFTGEWSPRGSSR